MIVSRCLALKLSDLFVHEGKGDAPSSCRDAPTLQLQAQREWQSAIASLEELLLSAIDTSGNYNSSPQALILSSPTPILSNATLIPHVETGIFKTANSATMALMPCEKLPREGEAIPPSFIELPFLVGDPLQEEQFCLIFTSEFCCLIVLKKDKKLPEKFEFSFEPEVVNKAWLLLKARLIITKSDRLEYLEDLIDNFPPIAPDYRLVSSFTRHLIDNLAAVDSFAFAQDKIFSDRVARAKSKNKIDSSPPKCHNVSLAGNPLPTYPERELLQALTHEIRTPLTTIKTLTKLLLKRAKLTPDLAKHLELIEQECTEQINRMELIFRAAELETTSTRAGQVNLVSISLEQIFSQSIPCWKKQAKRRNVNLEILIPQKLPQIVSDPAMLTQMLTGLMEKLIRNMPGGGQLQVFVSMAGSQLKLQFLSQYCEPTSKFKSLGQFLLFRPDTGSLSLSIDVTKNIFNALGGKLIVKQKPDRGEILTIFLPVGNPQQKMNSVNSPQANSSIYSLNA